MHYTDEVSITVSQNEVNGSLTLISISAYYFLRSWNIESIYNSPEPITMCSPDSSTWVLARGYVLLIFLNPSRSLGSSDGLSGSSATLTTDSV